MTPEQIILQAASIAARLIPEIIQALQSGESEAEAIARARANIPDAISAADIQAIKDAAIAKLRGDV